MRLLRQLRGTVAELLLVGRRNDVRLGEWLLIGGQLGIEQRQVLFLFRGGHDILIGHWLQLFGGN
jgi:hypothetical protein